MGVVSRVSDLSSLHSQTHTAMSDEEESMSNTSRKGDGTFMKARGEAKKGELDEQLKEYINEWRKQRAKEEEELKKLKDKQAKRKEIRAEQEKKLAQQKKEEEERLRKDEADKKRQEMMKAQKEKMGPASGSKKSKGDAGMGNVADVRREMTKTKEQLEEEKKISLSIRIHPLELDGMDIDALKEKGKELWDLIVKLETEKYDLEEKVKRQDYDLKELKERQRQQNKQKAIKLGLDPDSDREVSSQDPDVLQVRETYGHQDIRRQEEALRGRLGRPLRRAPGEDLEGEDGRMDRQGEGQAS